MVTKKQSIEFLNKTADVKFRVKGKDLEEAFMLSAIATARVMYDPEKISPKIKKRIRVEGSDKQALLYNFIEELLFVFETEFLLINNINSLKIEKIEKKYSLSAEMVGEKKSKKHDVSGGIKAMTYNEMKIEEKKTYVLIEAVLDL